MVSGALEPASLCQVQPHQEAPHGVSAPPGLSPLICKESGHFRPASQGRAVLPVLRLSVRRGKAVYPGSLSLCSPASWPCSALNCVIRTLGLGSKTSPRVLARPLRGRLHPVQSVRGQLSEPEAGKESSTGRALSTKRRRLWENGCVSHNLPRKCQVSSSLLF